jgi:hypothetical protein
VQLAAEGARKKGHDDRSAHVGFYLIDKGHRYAGTYGESEVALGYAYRAIAFAVFR